MRLSVSCFSTSASVHPAAHDVGAPGEQYRRSDADSRPTAVALTRAAAAIAACAAAATAKPVQAAQGLWSRGSGIRSRPPVEAGLAEL
jgi:hypothetical protein